MAGIIIQAKQVTVRYKEREAVSYRKAFAKQEHKKPYTALEGVSFSLYEGEALGLIGENGSGKTTLLRAIAGIYSPDEGEIILNAVRVSLVSLGIGFQARMSGRQNIYLSGYAMGASKKEILASIDDIIGFSELERFIDKPVESYSSGMYARLSFSISVFLCKGALLIDEALSVGDTGFQKKSMDKITQITKEKATGAIIASHSLDTLNNLCTKALWLQSGKLRQYGEAASVIESYKAYIGSKRR
ncbi:MAG: ABC transporter ATP-binding protein [Eubacteriaceae bacterium]|nr:ABC transporter ATP-binding protein [Eubacteriaceae bacterium]